MSFGNTLREHAIDGQHHEAWPPRAPAERAQAEPPTPDGAVPGTAGGQPGTHAVGYAPPPSTPGKEAPAQWPSAPDSLRRPAPAQPEPRRRAWGWPESLAGLGVAFAPEVLLYFAARSGSGGGTTTTVTVGSALVLVLSSFITYGWDLFAAWIFSLRRTAAHIRAWGFRRPSAAFFWTIPVALLAVYAVSYLHELVVHPEQQAIVDEFPRTAGGLALFLVLAVLMAPVAEEVFFRGCLFRGFANSWGWGWGAAVSGAVFGLAHLQLDVFVPLFALGFALAWVYQRTGSLWTSITLHAAVNRNSVLAWYLAA
jgi:membrane protease YdiL (CAAX protease family)